MEEPFAFRMGKPFRWRLTRFEDMLASLEILGYRGRCRALRRPNDDAGDKRCASACSQNEDYD